MSVKRAQAEIDRQEFVEWMAIYDAEPWGEQRADFRMATLASLLANLIGVVLRVAGSKNGRQYRPDDFLPRRVPKPQTAQQQIAIMRMFTQAGGGTIIRGSHREPER